MSFVDFMIVGAAKSGTTTLAEMLSNHPDVCFSRVKEPHFFSKNSDWEKNIDNYKSLFNPKPTQICGEASTTYTCYPEFNRNTERTLYYFNPKLKIIYIMRDPVNRVISHYMHDYLEGRTSEIFEKAVLSNPYYINRTRYFVQIKPYIDLFGQKQVLLLTFEEFIANKEEVLKRIANFLEIDYLKFGAYSETHANKSVGQKRNDVRVNNFLQKNTLIQEAKRFFPKSFRSTVYNKLQQVVARKLDQKPSVSDEFREVILNLLILDVLEIEKLMSRKINEWKVSIT